MGERLQTFVVFSDMARSTTASPDARLRHLEAAKRALLGDGTGVRETAEGLIQVTGDEIKIEYTLAEHALKGVLCLAQESIALKDGLSERVGCDVGAVDDKNLYRTKARAKRIMEMSPNGAILCSDDVYESLDVTGRVAVQFSEPFLVKLQGILRPIPVRFLGTPPVRFRRYWQTAARPHPGPRTAMAMFSAGRVSDALAVLIVSPFYVLFRNAGFHRLGYRAFALLHAISHLAKDRWPQLDYQSSVGLTDEAMLARYEEAALRSATHTLEIAQKMDQEVYLCLATYQMAHAMAHFEPSMQAESYFLQAYRQAEEEMSEPWFAGWSALYMGRSLRGRGKLKEAEDWLLASIVILTSTGDLSLTRQVGYALVQMARLRVAQGRLHEAAPYIELARQVDDRAIRAPDDAPWKEGDPTLSEIRERLAHTPGSTSIVASDPDYSLVETAVKPLVGHKKVKMEPSKTLVRSVVADAEGGEQPQAPPEQQGKSGPPPGFGCTVYEQLNHYVAVADAKAIALVGANVTFGALLLAASPNDTLALILTWIAAAVFGTAALIGSVALYPRLSKNSSSTIYWEGIASRGSPENYLASLQDLDEAGVERAYATENFYVSRVLQAKYRITRWCIILSVIGFMLAFVRIAVA